MPDPLPPPSATSSAQQVDSLSPAPPAGSASLAPTVDQIRLLHARKSLLLTVSACYGAYVLWCGFLLFELPDPNGLEHSLVSMGLLSMLIGVSGFFAVGFLALRRISVSPVSIATRRRSLLKLGLILAPGILLSITTAIMIIREPSLPIDIIQPTSAEDFVAPVSVTLSAERANQILRNLGHKPLKYQWDTNGDGKMDEETVLPTTTTVYQRQGLYNAVVRIQLDGGDMRRLVRRVTIPRAVFSMVPVQPIIQKAVKFSIGSLLTDPKLLKQIVWDFGDGTPAQTVITPDVVHTFFAVGAYPVSAVLQLQNQSETTYKRTVIVQEQPPLPFPITIVAEPASLIGPAPFAVLFRLVTDEPLQDIAWDFGDGKEDRGPALLRESHSFDTIGIYPVVVRARSENGALAELTTIVRATDTLTLRDLQFDGKPVMGNGNKISGEIPLEIDLKPKTSVALVQFSWEVPNDEDFQVVDTELKGILRKEGTTTVTLTAVGADNKSARIPITIEAKPPSAEPTILLTPDGGTAPLTVTFDASQSFIPPGETVAGFKWLFGDEGQSERNPELGAARVQHTYQNPGEYSVQLHIVLISGKEFTAKRTIIVRKPELSACITASRLTVDAGKGVEFDSSCSSGEPSSILWDIRSDNQPSVVQAQSSDAKYAYVFDEPGDYTVSLTLKNAFGTQDKKSVAISVTPAESASSSSP